MKKHIVVQIQIPPKPTPASSVAPSRPTMAASTANINVWESCVRTTGYASRTSSRMPPGRTRTVGRLRAISLLMESSGARKRLRREPQGQRRRYRALPGRASDGAVRAAALATERGAWQSGRRAARSRAPCRGSAGGFRRERGLQRLVRRTSLCLGQSRHRRRRSRPRDLGSGASRTAAPGFLRGPEPPGHCVRGRRPAGSRAPSLRARRGARLRQRGGGEEPAGRGGACAAPLSEPDPGCPPAPPSISFLPWRTRSNTPPSTATWNRRA